jgi:hypothetical protein
VPRVAKDDFSREQLPNGRSQGQSDSAHLAGFEDLVAVSVRFGRIWIPAFEQLRHQHGEAAVAHHGNIIFNALLSLKLPLPQLPTSITDVDKRECQVD